MNTPSTDSLITAATLGQRFLEARLRLDVANNTLANLPHDATETQVTDAEGAVARAKAFVSSWKAEFTVAAFEMFSA